MEHLSFEALMNAPALRSPGTPLFTPSARESDPGIDGTTWNEEALQAEIEFFKGIKPIGNRVLIRMYSTPKQTASGLILVENEARKYSQDKGVVLSLSPSCYTLRRYEGQPPWVKVGDWVQAPRANIDVNFYRGRPYACVMEDVFYSVFDVKDIHEYGHGQSTY